MSSAESVSRLPRVSDSGITEGADSHPLALYKDDAFDPENTEFKPVEASVEPGWGMPTVCPPDSAARASDFDYGFADRELDGHQMSPIPEGKGVLGTVVDSFYKYMDVCDSPQYRHFHSSSSYVFPWHPTPTLPLFTAGVHSHFSGESMLLV